MISEYEKKRHSALESEHHDDACEDVKKRALPLEPIKLKVGFL